MGKMAIALVMIIAIEISLALFVTCVPGDVGCNETDQDPTDLFSLLLNPQDWSSNSFFDYLDATFFVIAAGAIAIVVGLYWVKSDFVVFLGLAAVFFTYLPKLFTFTGYIADAPFWPTQTAGNIIQLIFTSGIIIFWIMACADFVRGRD